ncbi:RNA polymerase sigma factor [Spiractinospora alimapuensis]|uniref:RNA polymerase sigma factor n=1 Tax=Spiractinospora alimapuensis TaxID=2820884 RepID=UPI002ED0B89C
MTGHEETHRTVDAVWKLESARVIAGLTRMVRDVGTAEELAQDALLDALETWPVSGTPHNPGAWLMTVAKRRAVDHIRRERRRAAAHEQVARDLDRPAAEVPNDDVLRLLFLCAHPLLPAPERTALTLRLVGGLSARETARAFLTTESTITRRVAAAKRTLAEAHVGFEELAPEAIPERVASVLDVIYLVFNEGYSATAGEELLRPELCQEALRLGRLLAEVAPPNAEVYGLVALMELHAARAATRIGPNGEPVQLHLQNRGRWDRLLIDRGFAAMLRAREIGGPPGPYLLQAAIAVCHAQARRAEDTDWERIASLYAALATLSPTPVVRLNQAVAVGMAHGAKAGLDLVDTLASDHALRDYHLLPSVRGDLLERLGRHAEGARVPPRGRPREQRRGE